MLSAQNRVKYCLVRDSFFFLHCLRCRRGSFFSLLFLFVSFNRTLYFCLFGTVAPISAACLYYPIAFVVAVAVQLNSFLFSVLLIVNALCVDVSVGVVVVCNLRFCSLHFEPTVRKGMDI